MQPVYTGSCQLKNVTAFYPGQPLSWACHVTVYLSGRSQSPPNCQRTHPYYTLPRCQKQVVSVSRLNKSGYGFPARENLILKPILCIINPEWIRVVKNKIIIGVAFCLFSLSAFPADLDLGDIIEDKHVKV